NLKLQSIGLHRGHDQVVIRQPTRAEGFVAFYLKEGRVIAADCVNAILEFNVAKRLVAENIHIDANILANPETNLKTLASQVHQDG
ncbi:oxidoreductase C-terminal domain-containing protein, partial [Paraburkholderia sediminicola]